MAKGVTNEEMRQRVEALNKAEHQIDVAAKKIAASWKWAPYGKPSSGGPYIWNDIVVVYSDSSVSVMQAKLFIEEVERQQK